jgi:hypothetical protein
VYFGNLLFLEPVCVSSIASTAIAASGAEDAASEFDGIIAPPAYHVAIVVIVRSVVLPHGDLQTMVMISRGRTPPI